MDFTGQALGGAGSNPLQSGAASPAAIPTPGTAPAPTPIPAPPTGPESTAPVITGGTYEGSNYAQIAVLA